MSSTRHARHGDAPAEKEKKKKRCLSAASHSPRQRRSSSRGRDAATSSRARDQRPRRSISPQRRRKGDDVRRTTARRRSSSMSSVSASPPPPPPSRRPRTRSRSSSRRGRSPSPPPRRRRRSPSSRSRSPPPPRRPSRRHRHSAPRSASPPHRSRRPLPSQDASFHHHHHHHDAADGAGPAAEKEKINWHPTGLLAAETNTVHVSATRKVTLKYNEPADARKPPASARWRLYAFEGGEGGEGAGAGSVQLSARSCWLVGREAAVADLLLEHAGASKQHAVIQFRYVERGGGAAAPEMGVDDFLAEFGDADPAGARKARKGRVLPYLLDLESANGTYLNGDRIAERRFVELREKDVVRFGLGETEYVLMKE